MDWPIALVVYPSKTRIFYEVQTESVWSSSLLTDRISIPIKSVMKSPHLHNLDGSRGGRKEDVNILLKVNPTLHGYQGNLHLDKNVQYKRYAKSTKRM